MDINDFMNKYFCTLYFHKTEYGIIVNTTMYERNGNRILDLHDTIYWDMIDHFANCTRIDRIEAIEHFKDKFKRGQLQEMFLKTGVEDFDPSNFSVNISVFYE